MKEKVSFNINVIVVFYYNYLSTTTGFGVNPRLRLCVTFMFSLRIEHLDCEKIIMYVLVLLLLLFQTLSAHNRWEVYRGDSKNVIYSVKQSRIIHFKTNLDVYLATNSRKFMCDFKVKGSWSDRSCVIYVGDSNSIIAQMHKKNTAQSLLLGKDTFTATVYANVDYAFIVSLIIVLNAINSG
ncbi:hypothetical protein GIB67_008079 [Kingdonia uniflora]|uniref:Uncharacterized protein n=1 Tax=Kingdonia uniflora TaxID=39325 RepID=A0A7J7MCS7_9MAGN|nr:hypothetical protein GIB67_008079 [Kingdonia uniflora]